MEKIKEEVNENDISLNEIKEKFPNILNFLYTVLTELEMELKENLRLQESPAYWYADEKIEKNKKRIYRKINKIYFFIEMIKDLK